MQLATGEAPAPHGPHYARLAWPEAARGRAEASARDAPASAARGLRRHWPVALCLAVAAAALAALSAAGLRGGRGSPRRAALAGAVSAACPAGQCEQVSKAPFPKGDYQAAMDYLPVTTFFDLTEDRPWMPQPIIHKLPALIRKFDMRFALEENLGGWEPLPEGPPANEVRTVLCESNAPNRLLDWAQTNWGNLTASFDRTVVFSGTESPLSETWGSEPEQREALAEALGKYFKRIYYYVTDVELKGVNTLPLGFTEMYMRGRTDQFLDAYMKTNTSDAWKVNKILAAWGVYTTDGGAHYEYGKHPFVDSYGTDSPVWTEVANHAIDIRNDAHGWMSSPESKATGVQRRTIEKDQWWMELSKYKFILSPLGTAIQCSKVPEALSMLTIPIIKRGPFRSHDDLVRMGFPIVVVEGWAEITPESTKQWWEDLSPLLLDFRERCLTTEGYWRLLTTGRCSPHAARGEGEEQVSADDGSADDGTD